MSTIILTDYSQYGEQEYILNYFKDDKPNILEIGAFNGIDFSNSYALLLNGAKGTFIEADPEIFCRLKENYKNFDVTLICAAVGFEHGLFKWYSSNGNAVGTTNEAHANTWHELIDFNSKTIISQITIDMLLSRGNDYDMINVDVEGGSAELFLSMFHKFPNTKLWCIEHDGKVGEIKLLAKLANYNVLLQNDVNIIITK